MSREKGQPKTGGREKGTPNKVTRTIRESIFDIVSDSIDVLKDDLKKLEPKERLQIINGFLPYIVSKRQETSNRHYSFDFNDYDYEHTLDELLAQ